MSALKTALKILKSPLTKPMVTFLGEAGSGGILPGCTGYVFWTYIEEKKSGKSTNIAEYLTIGIPAVAADAAGIIGGISVIFLPLSYAISIPCIGLLIFWGFHKHGLKGIKPTKIKSKKS